MVPFGGYEMPVQYGGILKEHEAVRKRAGLFDLSHMGQFILEGEGVAEWADGLTVNAVSTMKPFQARYNIFCNAEGGAHDDVIFYRLPNHWLLVVNASNAAKMWSHLNVQLPGSGVTLRNKHDENALIAIQGPLAAQMVDGIADPAIRDLKYYFCTEGRIYGKRAVIARTGYTGEDGFEFFLEAGDAAHVWRKMIEEKRAAGLEPAGLGARDVLRLEAGMPLYGHELTESITPVQAGLAWVIKFAKPDFRGKAALEAQRSADDFRRIAGLVLDGRAPAREGYAVLQGGKNVGEIRSGSVGPSVGNKNIATALLEKDAAAPGTALQVEIRGSQHPATVTELPFYKRSK